MRFYEQAIRLHESDVRSLETFKKVSSWDFGRRKGTTPARVSEDMLQIRNTVAALIKVHGVDPRTTIDLATSDEWGACASFKDIPHFKQPYMLLSKNVYETCPDSSLHDVYCGLGLHEASHLNHTREMFRRLKLGFLNGVRKILEGLLEDERIEAWVRRESPGFTPYLHLTKVQLFEKGTVAKGFEGWDDLEDVEKGFLLFMSFIRCPHLIPEKGRLFVIALTKEEEDERTKSFPSLCVFEELEGILEYIPETEDEVAEQGEELFKLWTVLFPDDDSMSDESASALETIDKMDTEEGQKLLDKLMDLFPEDEFSIASALKTIGDFEAIGATLSKEETEHYETLVEEKTEIVPKPMDKFESYERAIYVKVPPKNESRYKRYRAEVSPYIARMRKSFSFRLGQRIRVETELREGKLHRRQLARLPISKNVFTRETIQRDVGISICLLLDASGSMGYERAENALKSAILMCEALKGMPKIELEVYSHTSHDTSEEDCALFHLYGKTVPDITRLGSYEAYAQNYDHLAIREAGKRFIADTTYQARILISLSDGSPAGLRYSGAPALKATKAEIKALEKKGVTVIGIGIGGHDSSRIYPNSLKFNNISELTKDLGKLLLKIVRKYS